MISLSTYRLLDGLVPAVLMVALIVLVFAVVVLVTLTNKAEAPNGFIDFLALYFPATQTKKKKKVDETYQKILGTKWFAVLPIILIPIIAGTTFITFWNVFLMEVSLTENCTADFQIDCFPKVESDYLQEEPIKNCSTYEFNDKVTYECYRLVFRYAEGFGAAGGFHLFTALWSKPYFSLLTALYHKKISSRYLILYYTLIWGVGALMFLLFLAISIGVPEVRESMFISATNLMQFVMYGVSLLLIFGSGTVVVIAFKMHKAELFDKARESNASV